MKAMCEFFAVSRAAYYEWVGKLAEVDPNQEHMEQVQTAMKLRIKHMAIVGLRSISSKRWGFASTTRRFCG